MLSQTDTLKMLGCTKMSLSRYVKEGKLTRHKKGRKSYYDEHEIAKLVTVVEENQKKVGVEVKEKESIPIKEDRKIDPSKINSDENILNPYGMEILRETTDKLIELDIYDKVYQSDLMDYSFNKQMYLYYSKKANELDSIQVTDNGSYNVHPYHRIMMDYDKKIKHFQDRYFLNPLALTKTDLTPKKESSSIMDILND